MKVLVATKKGQGVRKNDFFHTREGEFVVPILIKCDGAFADDDCGCARSMSGVDSLKGVTTVRVVETPVSTSVFYDIVLRCVGRQLNGFQVNLKKKALLLIGEVRRIANQYPVGTVLEYRDGRDAQRKVESNGQ